MKRTNPDKIIFSYQGDGDLAAIGTAEIVHAAHRGEQIAVIFINNAVFGMTGGQMAPTTILGQVTATTQQGRDAGTEGHPLQICELLSGLPGSVYTERCSVYDPSQVRKAKKAIKHAFELQLNNAEGLSLVEILSPCPTYWRMTPFEATKWIENEMTRFFPLGRFKG
jgi:2-oxoglutarate ferredoxin oxidoreductase subunit beta